MSSGDVLSLSEFGAPDDVKDDYDLGDQDAADAVADALESVGESGADYELARVIREQRAYKAHGSCLEDTQMDLLTVSEERAQELGITEQEHTRNP